MRTKSIFLVEGIAMKLKSVVLDPMELLADLICDGVVKWLFLMFSSILLNVSKRSFGSIGLRRKSIALNLNADMPNRH